MANFDLSFAELEEYNGLNPKPGDFDDYWQRAKNQIRFLNPRLELMVSEFNPNSAYCFNLYFSGVGGARVHAKYLKPKTVDPCPVVLMFHGYGGNSGGFAEKLSYVAEGFAVLAMDVRGQGGLSVDNQITRGNTHAGHVARGLDDIPDKLFYRNVYLDTALLAKIAATMLPGIDPDKIYCMGASQGGALALACAALAPEYIKKASIRMPFLSDFLRVYQMDLLKVVYGDLLKYFRDHDPMMVNSEALFTKLGYIDIQFLAPRVKAEVLWATGLLDEVCPPSTQLAAYNKLSCPKNIVYYPNHAHEDYPGHAEMVLNFFLDYYKDSEKYQEEINRIITMSNDASKNPKE